MKIEITQGERQYLLELLKLEIDKYEGVLEGKSVKKRALRKKLWQMKERIEHLRHRIEKTGKNGTETVTSHESGGSSSGSKAGYFIRRIASVFRSCSRIA